ncbi:MAG: hypothetical protein EPO40_31090 [Myxococcaceae bacterium]|nr:MAG: hypothetical protein EPO40_31090 [Myxococcaceae bacterium]
MKLSHLVFGMGVLAGSTTLSSVANAQSGGNMSTGAAVGGSVQVGAGTPPAALPASRSDNDPAPQVAAPVVPAGGIVSQAGIGGSTAYGRPGVVELGGSLGLNISGDNRQLTIAPSVGWFFTDNLQISGIVGFNYAHTTTTVAGQSVSSSASSLNVLAEPSYHLPLTRSLFAFLGVGLGLAYNSRDGAGFALAPRLGMNIMIGRSGILSPALQFVYSTTNLNVPAPGSASTSTLQAVNTSFGLNVGYTIML